MGVMHSLMEKSARCAELAERLGLMKRRSRSQTFRKIRDGLEQIGEEI